MAGNHKTPYQRRVERLVALGFSRRAAAGHAGPGEKTASGKPPKSDPQIATALERIEAGDSLSAVAKDLHLSRERLRRGVAERGDYVRQGRRYRFIARPRFDLPLYSQGETIRVVVDEPNAASLGTFMAAVKKFLRTNKVEHLAHFVGNGVTDIGGRFHPFEADPEELYRLDTKGRAVFHQIYQLSN